MINPSLLNVLKENEKINTDEYASIVAIKNMQGFISANKTGIPFRELRKNENLSQEQVAELELAEIFIPALSRFQPEELDSLFEEDIKDIKKNKKEKGLP
jgi:septum formation inhibitor MinC